MCSIFAMDWREDGAYSIRLANLGFLGTVTRAWMTTWSSMRTGMVVATIRRSMWTRSRAGLGGHYGDFRC